MSTVFADSHRASAMKSISRQVRIPYIARRFVSRYEPELREQICSSLKDRMLEKQSDNLTWEELYSAVNDALAAFRPVDEVSADPRMERLSLEAHKRGDFLSTRDFINELRAELAAAREKETAGA